MYCPVAVAQVYAATYPVSLSALEVLLSPSLFSTVNDRENIPLDSSGSANLGVTLPIITIAHTDPANAGIDAPMDTHEEGPKGGPGTI